MNQYTLFVLLSPFGLAISLGTAFYSWRCRNKQAGRPLAYTMFAVSAYLLFNTLELVNPTEAGTLFFAKLSYICIGIFTVNWIAFALTYSNNESWISRRYFFLLWVVPAVTSLLVFTNSSHHLIWEEVSFLPVGSGFLYLKVLAYGGWFWVFWIHSYLLILVGAVLLVTSSFSQKNQYRMQLRLSVTAALLPLMVNIVYVLHLIPGFQKDYSPLSYAASGILLAFSMFRYRMLDVAPFARTALIDSMNDAMFTLDADRRMVDYNPAALSTFDDTGLPFPHLGECIPLLESNLRQFEAGAAGDLIQSEIVLAQEHFDLQIRRLRQQHGAEVIGYLVLMHAITEHKKLLQTVRRLAEEDTLTGVLNRRRFFEVVQGEIERLQDQRLQFSILMIDLDHFKNINDTLGHTGGDQLLQAYSRRLRLSLRGSDVLGRIGGDEFIVLLPETELTAALHLAERLCQQVASAPMETEDYGACPVTISAGVADFSSLRGETLEQVITLADKGLYQAKAQGRNRACVYNPSLALWQPPL